MRDHRDNYWNYDVNMDRHHRQQHDQPYNDRNRRYERMDDNRNDFGRNQGYSQGRSYSDDYRSPDNDYSNRDGFRDQGYQQEGNYRGTRDDYYNTMYDTSNYTGVPRDEEYGLYRGPEDELSRILPFPEGGEGPYARREHYRFSQGYNLNYDNPEEGDQYRDFDSRGNHGYRHDASYGNTDEFRDFGNDRYGSGDRYGDR